MGLRLEMTMRLTLILSAFTLLILAPLEGADPDPEEIIRNKHNEVLREKLAQWTVKIAASLNGNEKQHTLVVLTNRTLGYKGRYGFSAYSFAGRSNEEGLAIKFGYQDLVFGEQRTVRLNPVVGQQHFVVQRDAGDFDRQIDPDAISIADRGIMTTDFIPQIGNVYLLRTFNPDYRTQSQFFLLKIVAADPDARFLGFVWRPLELKNR